MYDTLQHLLPLKVFHRQYLTVLTRELEIIQQRIWSILSIVMLRYYYTGNILDSMLILI